MQRARSTLSNRTSYVMAAPRSHGNESHKKSRATSCTSCRQVKVWHWVCLQATTQDSLTFRQLKCDLKERFPNPCSRCSLNHHECKTDASFKRVPARSRIKDLENQIDQLKRSRTFDAITPRSSIELTPELNYRTPSISRGDEGYHTSYAGSDRLSYTSPSPSLSETGNSGAKWLSISDHDSQSHLLLENTTVAYAQAIDLFEHFEARYLPQFCILEQVTSLRKLQDESLFLFSAILMVASRSHHQHSWLSEHIESSLAKLLASIHFEATPSLFDLQGILLLCAFPSPSAGHLHDLDWPHLGIAINAARQMGLDKTGDEMLPALNAAQRSLQRHPRHIRQLTWLKCFELDVQMSCWYGHLPSLTHAHGLRTIISFCECLPMHKEYAAIISTYAEFAQSLLALEDACAAGQQTPSLLLRMASERLNALKSTWASLWTLDAEVAYLTAKLYLYASGLNHTEISSHCLQHDAFRVEALQGGYAAAVQLSTLLDKISEDMAYLSPAGSHPHAWCFSGRPKSIYRSAFFAACILLKYLDEPRSMAVKEHETARNAFGKIYQLLASCQPATSAEHADMVRILSTAGRIIDRDQGRLQSRITTRMAASLRFDVTLLASQFGTADKSADFTNMSALLSEGTASAPTSQGPFSESFGHSENSYSYGNGPGEIIFNEPGWGPSVSLPAENLPYEAWSNTAPVDQWPTTMAYSDSTGVSAYALTPMTTLA